MWKDSETKTDFLDFDYLKQTIIDIVNNEKLSPSSIGIYGSWGSGKSSLMHMCFDALSKDKDTLCIKFNGWLFEGYEDAKTALIGSILDTITSERTITAKAKNLLLNLYKNTDKLKLASMGIKYGIDFLVTGGIGTIADVTLKSILSNIKSKAEDVQEEDIKKILDTEFQSKELRKNIKTFQDDFSNLLKETKVNKLIVFIDELDRCNPDTILASLEAIRLFLFTENTSFIVGADERHVTYSVKHKYNEIEGNQIDIGKEYLEKMIQYPIRIPQLSQREVEFYILCLMFENELSNDDFNKFLNFIEISKKSNFFDFELTFEDLKKELPNIAEDSKETILLSKQLSSVLSVGLNGNPRHCKRFLNSLSMREDMGKYRNIELNRKITAKLMLLEYFKTDLFKKLFKVQSGSKGKPVELALMEENNWDKVKDFKLWKDDKWVTDWINIEPSLSNIDLRPYFYFSRESLSNQMNLSKVRLSPIAQQALIDLLSGADSQRKSALKNVESINDSEAIIILDRISDRLLTDTELDTKILHSLLEWGASKELLYTGTISYLKEIPGSKINFSVFPRIKTFMNKTKKISDIKEITDRWIEENSKLKTAVEKIFKGVN